MSKPRHYLFFVEQSYAFEILRPLQQAARARGAEVAWFLNGLSVDSLQQDERQLRSVGEVQAFQPDAVFAPGNEVPLSFPGLKVQVFHGFGIEKKGHFRIRGMFDLFCTFGPLTTDPFLRLAEQHGWFKVVETGWPKMDTLFNFPVAATTDERKHILYAPTFSPSMTSAPALAEAIAGIVARRDWHWTVKFHPKMASEFAAPIRAIHGKNFEISSSTALLPLLHQADVMLTDTSSAAAEFMLLGKPVVAFRNRMPGPHLVNVDTPEELERALRDVLEGRDPSRQARDHYAEQMHPYRDGRSSERVLDAVEAMLVEGRTGLRRKPWSLLRRFKYWRELPR
ncbi:CDP-glycerol glycerophosphotransferase family protein [Rhodanobacter sp. AS-Z3]|uniref:CDP-glycerol glycerophosphotransferase family protein n=1 Tax=Rhodanobacter sp. AS-Z3 TaxID=3031330 RepID=UPI002479609F|nr:CDP-glycerol glycerophosphotransferase family protein [Rhodanobacter sp. AS-Z3]WEN15740.1 CDP-glycerol glycerophosphotransferase family protein [Rhodanobacter sp. AS-Z3]